MKKIIYEDIFVDRDLGLIRGKQELVGYTDIQSRNEIREKLHDELTTIVREVRRYKARANEIKEILALLNEQE